MNFDGIAIGDAHDGNDDGGVVMMVMMTIYLLVVMKMAVLVI